MSEKVYPWKKRLKPLSHRGRKEGRKKRLLAADEHLARRIYDDLNYYSPHDHIANPCYGLSPEKVRAGKAGREAYRRTARAILTKTHLEGYLGELKIESDVELVPLLRQCTDPKDGHIDWPKFVRHIVGLYYIAMIDPDWLLAKMPQKPGRTAQDFVRYNPSDVLSFYLLRPQTIRCEKEYWIGPLKPEKTYPSTIFTMVDTKLKHIIQNQKDDGDRARWKPETGKRAPAEAASEANLMRLYGGNPVKKVERDALNELRDAGRLNLASQQPGQHSKQRQRILAARELDARWEEEMEKKDKIEGLLEACEDKLLNGEYDVSPEKKMKAKKRLKSLENWLNKQKLKMRALESRLGRKYREIENGRINFFHNFEKLKEKNRAFVAQAVRERLGRYHTMLDLILYNSIAGAVGIEPNWPWPQDYGEIALLPHRSHSLYVPRLLGALSTGREEIPYINETLTVKEFAAKFRKEMRYELSAHGVIRSDAMWRLKKAGRASTPKSQENANRFLELLGLSDIGEIEKMGEEYYNKSRELYKALGKFQLLSQDEILQARAAYRSKIMNSDRVIFWEPPKAEEEEAS